MSKSTDGSTVGKVIKGIAIFISSIFGAVKIAEKQHEKKWGKLDRRD